MSKLEFDRDVHTSTRFAEGFYNGLLISLCHSFTYGIYLAKEDSIKNGRSFRAEYLRHMPKATTFYCIFSSATWGMRHLVLSNRDVIMSKLFQIHPIFKHNRTLTDLTLYMGIFLPLGTAINYISSGRIIRGTFTSTLFISLIVRMIESSTGNAEPLMEWFDFNHISWCC